MHTVGPGDILDHNRERVLSLVWWLILSYHIHALDLPTVETQAVNEEQVIAKSKRLLLRLINGILPDRNITNFTTDWNDGVNLSALINYCKPGLIPNHASLNRNNALKNIQGAMHLARKHLKVPCILNPRDLAVEKPDERAVMTYLAYFGRQDSPGEKALLMWTQQQMPNHSITNFTTDWVDGRALGALTNVASSGAFPDYLQLMPDGGVQNCIQSMDAAEMLLGVKKTVQPEQFADASLNPLVRIAYLVQFHYVRTSQSYAMQRTINLLPVAPHKVEVVSTITPDDIGESPTQTIVEIDCSQAGYGVVRAEAKGTTTGPIDVAVKELAPDKYQVQFQSPQPDTYELTILYGEDHIKGSPFLVDLRPPVANLVLHTAMSMPNAPGDPVSLTFDTSSAGRGRLTAKVTSKTDGSRIPLEIAKKSGNSYVVSFKPPTSDIYSLEVNWGKIRAEAASDKHGRIPVQIEQRPSSEYLVSFKVPEYGMYKANAYWEGNPVQGSPFTIDLLPPAHPEKVKCGIPIFTCVGDLVDLPIDTSKAGPGEIMVQCMGQKCGEVPVTIFESPEKPYQISFIPQEPDVYTISVLFRGTEVRGSPFTVDLRDSPTSLGYLLEAYAMHEETGMNFKQSIIAVGKGRLRLSFQPSDSGIYHIHILADGKDIPGCPVFVQYPELLDTPSEMSLVDSDTEETPAVLEHSNESTPDEEPSLNISLLTTIPAPHEKPPTERKGKSRTPHVEVALVPPVYSLQPPELTLHLQWALIAKVRSHEGGNISALAFGQKTGPASTSLSVMPDGVWKMVFNPSTPDQYTIDVKQNDKHVQGSPIKVRYLMPPPSSPSVNQLTQRVLQLLPQAIAEHPIPSQSKSPEGTLLQQQVMLKPISTSGSTPLRPASLSPSAQEPLKVGFTVGTEEGEVQNVTTAVRSAGTHQMIPASLMPLVSGHFMLDFIPSDDQDYIATVQFVIKRSHKDTTPKLESSDFTVRHSE